MKKMIVVSMLALVAALAVAGCKEDGKKAGGGEAAAVNASPECKEAGERVQELSLRGTKADAPDSEKTAAFAKSREVGDQVAGACTTDKWTPEAIACVKGAESLADCSAKLTPEQQKTLPTLP